MHTINTLFWGFAIFAACAAIPTSLLYDFTLSNVLETGDDLSIEIQLRYPIKFYGNTYKSIYINSNGLLSFHSEIPNFFNIEFPLDYPIIAPLYSNIDTTGAGKIHYFETADTLFTSRALKTIQDAYLDIYDFEVYSVFVVTWDKVGYHKNGTDKLNTFQVAIYSGLDESYVEFLYPENGIQWIKGTGDESGLPDARAQAGIISDDGRLFLLPGSGTDQVKFLDRRSNMKLPGQWLFRVGDIEPEENIQEPDNFKSDTSAPTTCAKATTQCHTQAKCVDFPNGFCCSCNKNYYGNGNSCIKRDIPLRVNGKVKATLNHEIIDTLDLQTYIVMIDGRIYTAMSKIPESIGDSIQTLQILGATIGWIFARPYNDALNGFQLTGGVFNHSATINFPNNGNNVTIRQKYLGLDVFDQLKLETEIYGNIPIISSESKIEVNEYQELYTLTAPGVVQSSSTRNFKITTMGMEVEVPFTIDQSFMFDYCKFDKVPIGTIWKLKVGKNFIGYESREQIVRFGMSNKIGPFQDVDPCREGRTSCGPNSSCVVDEESFKCICNPGFQYTYNPNGEKECTDINECTQGVQDCDYNAHCVNNVGSYQCICNSGFEGNGRICENAKSCLNINCNQNAECVESNYVASCVCMAGFTGNGQVCTPILSQSCNVANNCSPFGFCQINPSDDRYYCHCLPTYVGDGYNCTQMEDLSTKAVERCLLGVCWCPEGYYKDPNSKYCLKNEKIDPVQFTTTTSDYENESYTENSDNNLPEVQCYNSSICFCPLGFKFINNHCVINANFTTMGHSGINYTCNELDCHYHAQCLFLSSGEYKCVCKPGYEGNGIECKTASSCESDESCDMHASCTYDDDFDRSICICGQGYQGDGFSCHPIQSCASDYDCLQNEECVYSDALGVRDCVCKEGLMRDSQHHCVKTEGTCGGGICVENAECIYDEELDTNYCNCKKDFIGNGITECKPRPIGCNIVNNCGLHAICKYDFYNSTYECVCAEGFYGDGFICYAEKNCHVDPTLCDRNAICVPDNDRKYVCECKSEFSGNGSFCFMTPKHDGNFLLVNQGIATLKVPYETDGGRELGRPIQLKYYQLAVGLDVDCFAGRFYWSDINLKAIRSASYNGSDKRDFITKDIGSIEGLAIDWVSRNIYWTDSTKDIIGVANIDTKLKITLFDKNLVNPRGIAVHPQRGKIFWSDWDRANPKIEWANADGSGREMFLQGPKIVELPNSLTIDFYTEQLCYADAGTRKIVCVNIDTRQAQDIAVNCTYPFGISVTESDIYWSDWITKKIEHVNKYKLERLLPLNVPLGGTGNKLYGLVSVPDKCPELTNVCFHRDQCPKDYICLPDGKGSRKCRCGEKFNSNEASLCNNI